MLNLVILILTISNAWLVHGNVNSLVDLVCEATPKPYDCHQCLDGASGDTDKKSLAFRSITCSLATNSIVNGDFERLARASLDVWVRNACAKCQQIIGVDSVQILHTPESLLKGGDSVGAAKQVSTASGKWQDCSGLFPDPSSQPFFKDFLWLGNLYAITGAILNDL